LGFVDGASNLRELEAAGDGLSVTRGSGGGGRHGRGVNLLPHDVISRADLHVAAEVDFESNI
jgi:hypothetical protein